MSVLLVLGLAMVGAFGLIHALDQRRQAALRERMDGLITRRGRDTLEELELIVRENKLVLEGYYSRAATFHAQGRYVDAAERMTRGCRAIEALAPDFLTALAALRAVARTASAIVSLEAVSRRRFRRAESRGLAAVGEVVHDLLLTGRQQVTLRLHVIGAIFRVALRQLMGDGRRVASRPEDAHAWQGVEALVADMGTAGDEAVVTARHVVQALDAVELGYAIRHDARS